MLFAVETLMLQLTLLREPSAIHAGNS